MSRKRKARRTLERSRKKGAFEGRIKFSQEQLSLSEARLSLAAEKYEDSMIVLYRDANTAQRVVLEAEYQKVVGCSLKSVFESRIIAALQSQPRGVCDLSRAE
jgi:hypothetical protein